jgi:hypothetical protein
MKDITIGTVEDAPYEVVANAPIEGFFHRVNQLDTLGDDEPESKCHLNK